MLVTCFVELYVELFSRQNTKFMAISQIPTFWSFEYLGPPSQNCNS